MKQHLGRSCGQQRTSVFAAALAAVGAQASCGCTDYTGKRSGLSISRDDGAGVGGGRYAIDKAMAGDIFGDSEQRIGGYDVKLDGKGSVCCIEGTGATISGRGSAISCSDFGSYIRAKTTAKIAAADDHPSIAAAKKIDHYRLDAAGRC